MMVVTEHCVGKLRLCSQETSNKIQKHLLRAIIAFWRVNLCLG